MTKLTVEQAMDYARCVSMEGDMRVVATRMLNVAAVLADEVESLREQLQLTKDRGTLWDLLHEAAGWINSYNLGTGDRLYERIQAALDGEVPGPNLPEEEDKP